MVQRQKSRPAGRWLHFSGVLTALAAPIWAPLLLAVALRDLALSVQAMIITAVTLLCAWNSYRIGLNLTRRAHQAGGNARPSPG